MAAPPSAAHWVAFPNSIREVPAATPPAPVGLHRAVVARNYLSPEETASPIEFEVALRMRNFSELQARVGRGELVSRAEMAAEYLPLGDDYTRIVDWLSGQGLSITQTDENHLAVFAAGSVGAVAKALRVTFARVAMDSQEFTSAVTAPSLPSEIAAPVLGIHGLQTHLRLHRLTSAKTLRAQAVSGYSPGQILAAYNANLPGVTGAGQTIAVVGDAFPAEGDLESFWSATGVPQKYANITDVSVGGGPSSPQSSDQEEITLDTEWSSSIASGAQIRVYGAPDLTNPSFDKAYMQVYRDALSIPGLNQFSISYGNGEEDNTGDYLLTEAQLMANLAAAGVTVLSSSGDNGAYADGNNVFQVTYPASDPNVTGVGGTSLQNTGTTPPVEVAWSDSGGGQSGYFNRPGWQTGEGVPGGSYRLVPDVSSAADFNFGGYIFFGGSGQVVGGTSWATPTWAGFCALMNQARGGTTGMGALNPKIYPLLGTNAFRDITSGGNGTYEAGVGYDMVTGIGVPDITNLVANLASGSSAPSIIAQLGSQVTVLGQAAAFSVVADGAAPLAYQWQRLPQGAATWESLSDGGAYSGSSTATLVVSGVTYAMNGDRFQCVVSNSDGSATSSPADGLEVNPVGVTTLAGLPGESGFSNGTGRSAQFNSPGSVRTDALGNLYVADNVNNAIRTITPGGTVTTVVGASGTAGSQDGPVSSAELNDPSGVVVDDSGNIYVADGGNYTIRKISGGVVSTLAGAAGESGSVDGSGSAARFEQPENIAIDSSGNLYVPDGDGDTIRKITPGGAVSTLAGLAKEAGQVDGTGSAARLNSPEGIAADASGNVYVADSGNNAIRKVSPSGAVTTLAGSPDGSAGSADGFGTSARFNLPTGVAVDASGNVFVADSNNDTIREVTPSGSVTTVAGSPRQTGSVDGLSTSARFYTPADVAVDGNGIVYVADNVNNTVRRIVQGSLVAPQIQTQPVAAAVTAGQSADFTVAASGSAQLTYQWEKEAVGASGFTDLTDGGGLSGSATPTLTVGNATAAMSGDQFECVVSNNAGSATSASAALTVTSSGPAIATQPESQTINEGGTVVFTVVAGGSGSAFQWQLNGIDLANGGNVSGATGPQLEIQGANSANNGSYACVVTSGGLSITSNAAVLNVTASPNPGSLSSISARAYVGTGGDVLIGGFFISGDTSATVLIQAIGPALEASPYNVVGALQQPVLTLHQSQGGKDVVLYSNSGWGSNPVLLSAAATAYAQPVLAPGSADSELLLTLPPGGYTAEVSGADGSTGVALCAIYQLP
jgi:kumamolisin